MGGGMQDLARSGLCWGEILAVAQLGAPPPKQVPETLKASAAWGRNRDFAPAANLETEGNPGWGDQPCPPAPGPSALGRGQWDTREYPCPCAGHLGLCCSRAVAQGSPRLAAGSWAPCNVWGWGSRSEGFLPLWHRCPPPPDPGS